MTQPTAPETPAETRRDIRGVRISIWVGVAIGLAHGIPRYGLLHMGTVALIGLMVILSVSIYAAIVALMPARPTESDSRLM